MLSRLRTADRVAGFGAAVLFAATFAPWFKLPGASQLDVAPDAKLVGGPTFYAHLNVWDLSVARWFIYLAILSAGWMIVSALFADSARWSVILCTPTALFGICAAIGLIHGLINPPGNASVTTAFYAAVAGGVLLMIGGLRAVRDDGSPPGFDLSPDPEIVHLDSAP